MTTASDRARGYRIVVRGDCGKLLAGIFDGLVVESGRGWTCLVAWVRDESELYGLLNRLEDFALPVVSLSALSDGRQLPPRGLDQGGKRDVAWLVGIAADDPAGLGPALDPAAGYVDLAGLDARSHALVRLAGLVAAGAPCQLAPALDEQVTAALECGVTCGEVVAVLAALIPAFGAEHVTATAPVVLRALDRASTGRSSASR